MPLFCFVQDATGDRDEHFPGDDDGESAGTDGSERMAAARDLCSEDGTSSISSGQDDDGDGSEEEVLFPDEINVEGPAPHPPPPVPPPVPPPAPAWFQTLAGYTYTVQDDPRTCFGRFTAFRGQRAMRCYRHPGCSWMLPRTSTISSENLIRWALAGQQADVRTKEDHLRKRSEFS